MDAVTAVAFHNLKFVLAAGGGQARLVHDGVHIGGTGDHHAALAVGVTDLHNVHTVADHCQTDAQRRRRAKQHGAVRSGDFQTAADMFTGFD